MNCRFITTNHSKISLDFRFLKYPTGDNVPIIVETFVKINLGQYLVKMIVFVADIMNDCILGCNFFNKTSIANSVNKTFWSTSDAVVDDSYTIKCCKISDRQKKSSEFLIDGFDNSPKDLDFSKKETELLCKFHDIFQGNDVSGKCNVVYTKFS